MDEVLHCGGIFPSGSSTSMAMLDVWGALRSISIDIMDEVLHCGGIGGRSSAFVLDVWGVTWLIFTHSMNWKVKGISLVGSWASNGGRHDVNHLKRNPKHGGHI